MLASIWIVLKRNRDRRRMKVDLNVNYDTAGVDYEYGAADQDYDYENETSRREVKMEMVDRNSLYGRPEKDWEGSVFGDQNSVYRN